MNLLQIEIFVKVVDIGNFTKAGEILAMTQSGISHNIASLESELGIKLLNRGRNGISLTDSGERIINNMRNILSEAESIKQEAASILGIQNGKINIGSFLSFASKVLPTIISRFKGEFKGIEINFYEGSYDQITRWVEEGKVDIGFTSLSNPMDHLEAITIVRDRLVVIVPIHHHLAINEQVKAEDLQGEAFIMPQLGCEVSVKKFLQKHEVSPNIQFNVEENQTIIAMVCEGLGITIIPELALPYNLEGTIVKPLLPEPYREISIITRSKKQSLPAVKEFIKTTMDCIKELQL
ncbi:LysR family transcriptional regulator [Lysinibacillus capsici]|uniref:LysR family transcriptional regulator n=1 Tax=Lysinibacillus capsici TaxID=2115968 RepID=UPI003081D637|nr:LysR family transcriptional regulator [Lysinibacillus capsici]